MLVEILNKCYNEYSGTPFFFAPASHKPQNLHRHHIHKSHKKQAKL